MRLDVKIGERDVIGSGQVVLGPEERQVTFVLDGVHCAVTFAPIAEGGPFQVRFERRDATHLFVESRGRFPAGALSWTFNGLLELDGQEIDLDLMVFSETDQFSTPRRISYTFMARAKGAPGMIDPTSPTGARLADSTSAPPPVWVRPA